MTQRWSYLSNVAAAISTPMFSTHFVRLQQICTRGVAFRTTAARSGALTHPATSVFAAISPNVLDREERGIKKLWVPISILTALTLHAGATAARNETLRCGSKIITIGMSTDDVRKYCGAPTSERIEEVPVRSGNRVTGTTQMWYWTYNRGSGQKPATLQFDQATLVSITYD